MTMNKVTAGDRLRADLDAALANASAETGRPLKIDEAERHVIEQAAAAADRAEQMQALYRAELARKPKVSPESQVQGPPPQPSERFMDRLLRRFLEYLATSSDRIFESRVRISAEALAASLDMPVHFVEMLLTIEDKRFALHFGIDPFSQLRAAIKNMRRHRRVQGASTITQQLYDISNTRSDPSYVRQRSIRRKIKQAVWAIRRELTSEKVEILAEYLENVYWGRNFIGLDAAALGYFNQSKQSLTMTQSFFLTAKLGSPNTNSLRRVELLLNRPAVRNLLARDICSHEELRSLYRRDRLATDSNFRGEF